MASSQDLNPLLNIVSNSQVAKANNGQSSNTTGSPTNSNSSKGRRLLATGTSADATALLQATFAVDAALRILVQNMLAGGTPAVLPGRLVNLPTVSTLLCIP